jgi:hypothetical protein
MRAGKPLKLLETSVSVLTTNPLTGCLEISTDEGLIRLAITGDVAADLRIDINQFLAAQQSAR